MAADTTEQLPKTSSSGGATPFRHKDIEGCYGSKAVPTTVRDAAYVLDEILNNETELPILEHTTDTAGYTEVVFALFDLLGLQFSPRIRDLADQQLYRTSSVNLENYPNLKSHLFNVINKERISQHWDDMLRLAGSLKQG